MPVSRKLKRPPSKLAALKKALTHAIPKGLPKAVARFYAQGDGLSVSLSGEREEVAVIVGLDEMFGGQEGGVFRAHEPAKKLADTTADDFLWGDRPHYEKFFSEEIDFEGAKGLKELNLRLRLKLLVSIAGESADLAIDFFDGPEPTLYFLNELELFKLNLTFDEFIEHFSRFGSNRWYFAFLDKKAGEKMNVDLLDAFDTSLAGFDEKELAPLRKRVPKKKAEKKPVEEAAPPEGVAELWAVEAKEALASREDTLWFPWASKKPGAWEAFTAALDDESISLQAAWSMSGTVEHVPDRLLPALFTSKRMPKHDQLWSRYAQLGSNVFAAVKANPAAFEKLKLDPLMRDVLEVVKLVAGVQAAGTASASVRKAMSEWVFAPPLHIDRSALTSLAEKLSGVDAAVKLARAGYDKQKKYRPLNDAGVQFIGPTFELEELIKLTGWGCRADALAPLVKERGWKKAQVVALAKACAYGYYEKKHVGESVPNTLNELAGKI